MAKIIGARFETQPEADRALDALRAAGFGGQNVTSFYLNQPGQHARFPVGGDTHQDEGTKQSGKTAATGAAVGGITGLALGTAAAMATEPGFAAAAAIGGTGVGAFVGSLAGALSGTKETSSTGPDAEERKAGVMVAILADAEGAQDRIVQTLRAQGAHAIEQADGEWRDGAWVDFNPERAPQLL
jgi:hypothetical protein